MKYLCFLALFSMLPVTATAQQQVTMGAARSAERRSEQRQSDRSQDDRQSDRGQGRRGDRGDERRSSSNDQRSNTNTNQQRQQNSFLSPLGLQPIPSNKMPWWEQKQTPWWERQGQPSWERQQPHQPEWAREIKEAQDRRLGKTTVRARRSRPAVVYVLPPYQYFPNNSIYGYGVSSSTYVATPPPDVLTYQPPGEPPVEVTTGFLQLEVEPRHLVQVFVDGLYLGQLADLGSEIELRLGARRIELRAPGYRTLVFDTEIVADRTIVYRGALQLVSTPAAPAPPATPAPPAAQAPAPSAPSSQAAVTPPAPPALRTIYLIPGCYMGNVAPKAAQLRAGCDINNLQKIEP